MSIKAVLLDFDGTLVTRDMLSEALDLVGKKAASEQIDRDFQSGKLPGLSALIMRINLLKGVTVQQIQDKVREDLALMEGAVELLEYCRSHGIVTILASGSIVQILEVYQQELGMDYIVGSEPVLENGILQGIGEDNYPKQGNFKVVGISAVLKKLKIDHSETVAIGDGRGDLPMFQMAGVAIAINPKGGIEEFAQYQVKNLHQALQVIVELQSTANT